MAINWRDYIRESAPPDRTDKQAEVESKEWDNYEKESNQEHGFRLILNNLLFWLSFITICIVWLILVILGVIWVWHLISKPSCHYLDRDALQTIERILFSSVIISIGSKYVAKLKVFDAANKPKKE